MPAPLKKEGGNIYYELYIDIFILVNFIMDYVILTCSKNILKCPVTQKDICLGAIVGALLTGLVVILPIPYSFVKFVLFHGPVNIVMIKTGLRIRQKRKFLKAYTILYICSFLAGGIFACLQQFLGESWMFLVIAFVTYFLASGIWNYISKIKRCEDEECEVLLQNGKNEVRVRALIDTGNRLKDELTGKPVSIISKDIAMELGKEIVAKDIRYISYHTIGKRDGVMPVFLLERMCLYLGEELWVNKPLVAVSEEFFCEGECKMILNPDVK